jgi:putative peptidoglycan binding protein
MKTTRLFSLIGTTLIGLGVTAWAGPHAAGGAFAGGGHFGGYSGGIRPAPTFSGSGLRFSGNRSIGGVSRAPQQFYYYSGARTTTARPQASARQLPERSISANNTGRAAAVNRRSNRVDSTVGQKRVSDPRLSTAAGRQSFMKDHAFARHDANWHRDWDKRRAHFHRGHVFVFIDGFWWGLFPWDYYPYYASDYYPYDYYDYDYYPYGYDDQSAYVDPNQYGSSSTVSAVQSKLAELDYYRGTIDGVAGDDTQAAIARYQEDHDLSVTGTVTAAILQSLGLAQKAS